MSKGNWKWKVKTVPYCRHLGLLMSLSVGCTSNVPLEGLVLSRWFELITMEVSWKAYLYPLEPDVPTIRAQRKSNVWKVVLVYTSLILNLTYVQLHLYCEKAFSCVLKNKILIYGWIFNRVHIQLYVERGMLRLHIHKSIRTRYHLRLLPISKL